MYMVMCMHAYIYTHISYIYTYLFFALSSETANSDPVSLVRKLQGAVKFDLPAELVATVQLEPAIHKQIVQTRLGSLVTLMMEDFRVSGM